jgi:hypothetical protein
MLANPHFTSHHLAHSGVPLLLAVAGTTVALTLAAFPMPHPVIPGGATHLGTTSISPCAAGSNPSMRVHEFPERQWRPHLHTAPICVPFGR